MAFPRALAFALLLAPAPVCAQTFAPIQLSDADALAEQVRRLGANPLDLDALLTAGELSVRMEDLSAAGAFFARAEKIDTRNGRAKAGEGAILVRAERPGEALRYFAQAEQLGLTPARFASDRGLAYDLLGDPGRAQRDYKLALAAHEDAETRRRYALSLGIAGRQAQALDALAPLVKQNDRGAWRARAFILAMGGQAAEASRIAQTMMPPGAATGLQSFFADLPRLPVTDRAFAVHFGEVHPTPQRLADARMAPVQAPLALEPLPPVQVAVAVPPVQKKGKRDRHRRDEVAVVVPAALPATPQPTPPAYQAPAYSTYVAANTTRDRPLTPGEQASLAAAGGGRYARSSRSAVASAMLPAVPRALTSAEQASLISAGGRPSTIPNGRPQVVASLRVPTTTPVLPSRAIVARTNPVPIAQAAAPVVVAAVASPRATLPTPGFSAITPVARPPVSALATPVLVAADTPPRFTSPAPAPIPGFSATALGRDPVGPPALLANAAAPTALGAAAAVPVPVIAVPVANSAPIVASVPVIAGPPTASAVAGAPPVTLAATAASTLGAPAVDTVIPSPGAITTPIIVASTETAPPVAAIDTTAAPALPNAGIGTSTPLAPLILPTTNTPAPVRERAGVAVARGAGRPRLARGEGDAILAKIVAGLTIPASELDVSGPSRAATGEGRPLTARERRAAARLAADEDKPADTRKSAAARKALADRKTAADKKAAADQEFADARRIERAQPKRIWVQVAGGANEADLAKAWRATRTKAASALTGRQGYTTPLRATNRVLTGPFKTDAEARAYVNQLAKAGVSAFTFTSDPGQKITKLDAK